MTARVLDAVGPGNRSRAAERRHTPTPIAGVTLRVTRENGDEEPLAGRLPRRRRIRILIAPYSHVAR